MNGGRTWAEIQAGVRRDRPLWLAETADELDPMIWSARPTDEELAEMRRLADDGRLPRRPFKVH